MANLLVIALLAVLAIESTRRFLHSGTLNAFGVLIVNGLFLALFLTRREAKSETTSPGLWLLGFLGTILPLLMRPAVPPGRGLIGAVVELAGLAMLVVALLSLRRSFAIVPANRGIRDGGFYGLVRHPLYLSELTLLLGVLIANPTPANTVIWLTECGLQFARALAEERYLITDPRYRAYCERVPYRLIPGVLWPSGGHVTARIMSKLRIVLMERRAGESQSANIGLLVHGHHHRHVGSGSTSPAALGGWDAEDGEGRSGA